MCKYFERICKIEAELAFLRGRESQESALGRLAAENADLRARIGDLHTDLKLCRKPDGDLIMPTNKIGHTYLNETRVLESRPPVVIEEHRRECGEGK